MSLLDERREIAIGETVPAQPRATGRRLSACVVAPAGIASFIAVTTATDLAHGALAAAIVILLTVLALRGDGVTSMFDGWLRWQVAGAAALAGSVAGVGALSYDGAGSTVGYAATVGLSWVAIAYIRREPNVDRPGSSFGDIDGLIRIAASAVLVICAAAIVVPSVFERLIVAGCAPAVGLALFALISRRTRRASDGIGVGVQALVAGIAAALLALATPHDISTASIALGTALPTAAALALFKRARRPVRAWVPSASMALAFVMAGAATGPISVVAVAAAAGALVPPRRSATSCFVDKQLDIPMPTGPDVAMRRAVAGLTAVAIAMRLFAERGLWLDEATSVHQARMPFNAMLQDIYKDDNHPPLHHIVLWLDIRLVGDSELALRLPAVVLGALLVPMLFVTGRALFGRRIGAIAAAIGTVAPIAVWYGQEARMYSQFMLLSLVSVHALVHVIRSGDKRFWAIFTLSSVALMYTQYFAVLHVGATIVVLVIEVLRRRRVSDVDVDTRRSRLGRGLAISVATQVIVMLPLVPWILHQAARNQQEGFGFSTSGIAGGSDVVPPPGVYGLLTNVQWAIFGYQNDQLTERLVALWPIGLLLLLFTLGRQRRVANRYLILIAGLPVAFVFGASFLAAKSRSLAEVRYFAGAVPLLFILLAAGLVTVITSRRAQQIVVGGLMTTMLVAAGLQETSTDNPRLYQYREAVDEVREMANPGDIVLYAPFYLNYVLEYYNPGVPAMRASGTVPATPGKVFLVSASSFAASGESDREIDGALEQLRKRGLDVEARYDFAQVTVWEVG